MITFNPDKSPEDNTADLQKKLQDILNLRHDYEAQIKQLREAKDDAGLRNVRQLLEILYTEEERLRIELGEDLGE